MEWNSDVVSKVMATTLGILSRWLGRNNYPNAAPFEP